MSFFEKLRKAVRPSDERLPRAMLTPCVSAIMADGDMQAEEISQLSNLCSFSPIFHHIHPERLAEIVRELIAEIMEEGGDAKLQAAAADLPPSLRETAYCFVARIVMADGMVGEREKMALEKIAAVMKLEPNVTILIEDVVKMMQRQAVEA
ncbi:MAG: tellurite resistance TerB family protein [Pseudomonadota bacterium]